MNKPVVGDVYCDPRGKTNPFVLVKVTYFGNEGYQLLGCGLSVNSNAFFNRTHTIEEIIETVKNHGMVCVGNIEQDVTDLIAEKVRDFQKSTMPKSGNVYKLSNGEHVYLIESENGWFQIISADFSLSNKLLYNDICGILRDREAVFVKNISVDKLFS